MRWACVCTLSCALTACLPVSPCVSHFPARCSDRAVPSIELAADILRTAAVATLRKLQATSRAREVSVPVMYYASARTATIPKSPMIWVTHLKATQAQGAASAP